MKRKDLKKDGRYALFLAVMILGALLMIGCGSTGDTGPAGPAGAPGAPGTTGTTTPVTTTGETCNVCHSAGAIADVAVYHPNPTGKDVTLSSIQLTNNGGIPTVTFHAATTSGPVTGLVSDDFYFMIADLVPGSTAVPSVTSYGTWASPYFERWAYEGPPSTHGTYPRGTFTDLTNGDYSYAFLTTFADATTEAPDYSAAHTQRLVIVASGHDDANGNAVTNNTVGFLDFVVPAVGAAATPLDSQRLFVTADACKKCHGSLFQQAAHADTYLDTRTCVICHSPLGHYGTTMQTDNAYLSVFIHQIHAAIPNTKFETQVRGLGFEGVAYPQDIEKCVVCHNNNSNMAGIDDQTDNWKNHPTAEICSSCHTTVDFAPGTTTHPGGAQTNDTCKTCHPASGFGFGKSVTVAHNTTPHFADPTIANDTDYDTRDIPEYDVTLTPSPYTNGSYYGVGEAPMITVTLKDHVTGLPVASSLYTTPQDSAGHSGGGLSVASLYVYGPRAKAVPVLTTGSTTDPSFKSGDTPTQGAALFVDGNDPKASPDNGGFHYLLQAIPAGMTAGTYMVRVRIGDYGRVGTGNYHIESTAFTTIQIGTATVEDKVAGDACINCHGTGTAPFHDERHAVVFDTDQCLSCHDQSGNHAIPIANRVHAVHSADSNGDLYFIEGEGTRDWSDITYPQNIQMADGKPQCVSCHTSGDGTYLTKPFMMPCVGCHGDADGILDHMRQNGGPF
jgi:hypothetical protein